MKTNPVNIPLNINGKDMILDPISTNYLDGIIYISETIDEALATEIAAELRYLNKIGKDPIYLIIQSPGGSVSAGLSILDTIQTEIESTVYTVAAGMVASMAAVLLTTAAPKGNRYIMPNAKVMLHQPLIGGGLSGQATEISIVADEILKVKQKIISLLAAATGQSEETVKADTERDYYLTATEAVAYGVVDTVGSPLKKEEV